MQRTRNPLRVQILRGFESHRFRQKTLTAGSHGGFFVRVVSITIKNHHVILSNLVKLDQAHSC